MPEMQLSILSSNRLIVGSKIGELHSETGASMAAPRFEAAVPERRGELPLSIFRDQCCENRL
jgi:hypothetical protein